MEKKILCRKTTFICFKTILCVALAIPHSLEYVQCFLGTLTNFKNSNNSFRFSNFIMGFPFFRRWKLPQIKYNSIFFQPFLHSTLIESWMWTLNNMDPLIFSDVGFQNFGNTHPLQLSNEQSKISFYLNANGDHQV